MKISFRILLSTASLVATMTALPAIAADYDPPIVVDPVEEVPVEVGSGWYLRGDIGYNFSTDADGAFTYRTFDPLTGTYGNSAFATGDLSDEMTFGGGVGYSFTDWIRADVTLDGYRVGFDGATFSALPCSPAPIYAGTTCRSEDDARASVLSFMANGYVDLGTYVGLTPYAGAGIGYSYVDWGALGDTVLCVGATCPGGSALFSQTGHEGLSSWRFTYALMVGLAYDIYDNVKLDLGYRYRHIDGGPMFAFDPATIAAGAGGTQGDDPGFDTHEVRLGFRYALW